MSPRRFPGASLRGIVLLLLWLSVSTAQAALGSSAHARTGELRAELAGHSVQALRHDVSRLRREFRHYRHARHHRARTSPADLLRRPGRTLADDVHAHPPEDEEAVQSGFSLPWREDVPLAEPPTSAGQIACARSPFLIGLDYTNRHSPRGPPA